MKQQGLDFELFKRLADSIDTQNIQAPISLIQGYFNSEQQAAMLNEVNHYPLIRSKIKVYG